MMHPRALPIILFIAALVVSVTAFRLNGRTTSIHNNKHSLLASASDLDDATRDRLASLVTNNKILLFMKGNKVFPQCGFSNTACRILDQFNVPYETVDVLADDKIRSGVKVFSSWPTIPQLYVNGEFIGGSDIMMEMYKSGELAEMLEVAAAN